MSKASKGGGGRKNAMQSELAATLKAINDLKNEQRTQQEELEAIKEL